ncbi:MAG: GntR family transcriptional regulator [Candidatus Competibacteraceae bacterium]|nr:GntR family transcriptional regulator [Candidatus Competibacteraceae bacterium]MCB1812546.1 GntR family transcriptional regulator [Candidatus Competibacteraceae bacterium]
MTTKLAIERLDSNVVLKDRIYSALKEAISTLPIYADNDKQHRLDERQLSEKLGVSRTPVREALCRLEQEGLVKMIPRRGAFVVRKTKQEILDMIFVWAALESMAARLIVDRASDEDIASLRRMFATFEGSQVQAKIDEYSDKNVEFHQTILNLSRCQLLENMTENLFIHLRGIRRRTITENDRASRSIIDHMHIIEALEARDADRAERLVREHTLNLAKHIEENVHYLD